MSRKVKIAGYVLLALCSIGLALSFVPVVTWALYKNTGYAYVALPNLMAYIVYGILAGSGFAGFILGLCFHGREDIPGRLTLTLVILGIVEFFAAIYGLGCTRMNVWKLQQIIGIEPTHELLSNIACRIIDYFLYKVYLIDEKGVERLYHAARLAEDPVCLERCPTLDKTCIERCNAAVTYCRSALPSKASSDDLRKCVDLYLAKCGADLGCILAGLTN